MHGRIGIPLRNRESFFGDPFFSDCWDPMDRQQKEWEDEYSNLRSNRHVDDLDDLDLGFRRRLGHRSLRNRMFGRDTHDTLIDKERELLKKLSTETETKTGNSENQSDKENFKILLDVQQFKPQELSVNFVDGSIVIEGKQEDKKDDHGFLSCNFTRKYLLPAGVKVENVQCNLSSDGVLHVTAPILNPELSNKTSSSLNSSSNSTETTEQSAKSKKSDEAASSSSKASSTAASSSKAKDMLDDLRLSGRGFDVDDDEIFGHRSNFGRLREDGGHRRHIFDSYFTGFPDYELSPFWNRRRDWSDGQSEAMSENSKSRVSAKSSEVQSDLENFKVQLDVSEFTPEELSIKVVNNFLIVEGKQEEKKDSFGSVSRNFSRKYEIPSDVKAEDIQCIFSKDKMLILRAVRVQAGIGSGATARQDKNMESSKETVHPISVGASASASAADRQMSGTCSSNTTGNRDGREHVVQIRLEQGDSSALRNLSNYGQKIGENVEKNSSSQETGGQKSKQPLYNSNLMEMLGTFSDDLKAIDKSTPAEKDGSSNSTKASNVQDSEMPRELNKYLPQGHDSNLLGMLEDFQDKLKTISKSPPPERKDYTAPN